MNHNHLGSTAMAHIACLTLILASSVQSQYENGGEERTTNGAIIYAQRGYLDHAQLGEALRDLSRAHGNTVVLTTIGESRDGRAVFALRVATDGATDPEGRPALLITAGIDGDHLLGTEVTIEIADRLATMAAEGKEPAKTLLSEHAVYLVPRVNPDAAERYFADVKLDWRRNMRPDDRDRDAAIDEDHPNDLNGDGLIMMMRIYDPAEADLMLDPSDDRLHVKPNRDKGERAEFALIVEGVDDDGDDEINEDWIGGVDLNRNFPHGYEEHSDGAGPYQLSEPESLALIDFVLARPNIAVALTYGVHDNLSKSPDGKGQHPSSTPKNIDEKDVGVYSFIGERFKEITGLKSVPNESASGAFYDWAYAQFGIPSFTTPLWTRPETKRNENDKAKGEGEAKPAADGDGEPLTPSGLGDISQETIDELEAAAEAAGVVVTDDMRAQVTPAEIEQFAGMMGIKVRRIKKDDGAAGNGVAKQGASEANKDESAWLKYSDDERGGEGFVAWTEVEHPKYDKVEVGGWVPYFKLNPPGSEIDAIAERQVEFVLDLLDRLPAVSITEPEVKRLSAGLYEIQLAVANDGYFPAGTAMAVRNRKGRPYVLRLDVPIERIVSGQRVQKYWAIPGSGGREEARWIIESGDDAEIDVVLYSEKFGEVRRTIQLEENETGEVGVDDVEKIRSEVKP
jgi:hypothetical protein